MPFIGKQPTPVPLTSSDITDGIISTDKLADTSVTNAKINADLISAETELATAPASTDEFLISDAGTLKRIDASLVGGKDFELLGTSTASSSASITIDGLFSSTYKNYKVVYSYLVPASNSQYLGLNYRVSSSDVTSSDYSFISDRRGNNSSNSSSNDAGVSGFATSSISLSMSTSNSASYGGASGFFYLFDPLDTSSYKLVTGQAHNFYSSTQQYYFDFAAVNRASTAALSGLTFSFGSGNIASGSVKLYGMK